MGCSYTDHNALDFAGPDIKKKKIEILARGVTTDNRRLPITSPPRQFLQSVSSVLGTKAEDSISS